MARLRLALGLLVSAIFLWIALQGQDLTNVWETLTHANYLWIVPGILAYFLAVLARTWRWHYLLRSIKPVSLRTLFPIVTIGYMGNNIYPARAGEVLRAYVLRREEGVPVSASLATIVIERIFDGVVMLMFIFFNLGALARLTGSSGLAGNIQGGAAGQRGVLHGAGRVLRAGGAVPAPIAAGIYRWLIRRLLPIEFQGAGAPACWKAFGPGWSRCARRATS